MIKKLLYGLFTAALVVAAPVSVNAAGLNPNALIQQMPLSIPSQAQQLDAAAIQAMQAQQLQAAQALQAQQLQAAQALQAQQLKAAQDLQAQQIKAAQELQKQQSEAVRALQEQQLKAAQMLASVQGYESFALAQNLAVNCPDFVYVDISDQMAYCYRNNTLIVASPCVTGNTRTKHDTTIGVHKIILLDTNRMLKGSYGTAHVDYWMRFTNGGQGLHDAKWRKKFGGNIYTYDGSHGCVNLPKDVAATIYANAYLGMPVIVAQ